MPVPSPAAENRSFTVQSVQWPILALNGVGGLVAQKTQSVMRGAPKIRSQSFSCARPVSSLGMNQVLLLIVRWFEEAHDDGTKGTASLG